MSKVRVLSALAVVASCALAQEPMTLEQCVDYALRHSRELAQREIAFEGQQFTTMIERGVFRPRVNSSANHGLNEDNTDFSAGLSQDLPAGFDWDGSVRGEDDPGGSDSASASFRVSKQILGGGSYRASMLDIDNSIIEEMIRLNRVHRYRRDLVFRVRRFYYQLIRNQLTRRINDMRVERARKNLEFAIERQDPLDIATARIELPENEAAVLRAERQIATTLDELKELIGMDIRENLDVDTQFQFEAAVLTLEQDMEYAFENDEEILNARLDLQQLENELPVSREQRWPDVTLSATSRQRDDGGMNFNGDSEVLVGVALSWELGGITQRYRVRRLQTEIASQILDVETIRQSKMREIRNLARRLEETVRLIELQEQKVEVAELRAELYRDRWENGEIDILEYIRSQNDLENSRIQLINLQTTYMELLGEYIFTIGR